MIQRLSFELMYLLRNPPWDTGVSPGELLHFLEDHPPGRALDLGCGTGTNAITMANKGWDVVGVDLSTVAIKRARRKAHNASLDISFLQGDVTRLDEIVDPFDFVLDIGCFHGLSNPKRSAYERNLRRLLKSGGTFLLYTWLKAEGSDRSWSPTEAQICELFKKSMSLVQVEHGVDAVGNRSSAWFTMHKLST